MPWLALVALPLAAWTIWRAVRTRTELGNPALQLPLAVFLVMLVVLSAASSARTLYGLPMLVPLAMLGAPALDSLPERLRSALEHTGFWGGIAMVVGPWGAWLALLLRVPAGIAAQLCACRPLR